MNPKQSPHRVRLRLKLNKGCPKKNLKKILKMNLMNIKIQIVIKINLQLLKKGKIEELKKMIQQVAL